MGKKATYAIKRVARLARRSFRFGGAKNMAKFMKEMINSGRKTIDRGTPGHLNRVT
jgi:hypothetical protein